MTNINIGIIITSINIFKFIKIEEKEEYQNILTKVK